MQFFTEDWQEVDHIRECLPQEEEGVDIRKLGKLCGGYYCEKRHSKPWDVKEGGDTCHIRSWPGKVVGSSRESHLIWVNQLTHLKRLGGLVAAQATTTEL